jgi:hypothetical protein
MPIGQSEWEDREVGKIKILLVPNLLYEGSLFFERRPPSINNELKVNHKGLPSIISLLGFIKAL